eukprot:6196715-Pleurochrysis_carterae.AAC.1
MRWRTDSSHPPPRSGGVLFSRATPHDGVASAHVGAILSPTPRPTVSPAGAAVAVWMARQRPRAGYRPRDARGSGVATQ